MMNSSNNLTVPICNLSTFAKKVLKEDILEELTNDRNTLRLSNDEWYIGSFLNSNLVQKQREFDFQDPNRAAFKLKRYWFESEGESDILFAEVEPLFTQTALRIMQDIEFITFRLNGIFVKGKITKLEISYVYKPTEPNANAFNLF